MPRYVRWIGSWGVSRPRGGRRSPLCGLPTRPIFWPWPSRRYVPASESSSPEPRRRVPQPSWATTKETAAWRFGA